MKMKRHNLSRRDGANDVRPEFRNLAEAPIRGNEYAPRVVLFYGRRGNGKSLLATAFAKTCADRWARAGAPKKVLTNFAVEFADHHSEDLYSEMTMGDLSTVHSIIVIDEVAEIMPSMRANTREALDMQSWLKAIRKQGSDVILTTQRPHDVLGSVRFQTDFFISCVDPYRRDSSRKGRVVNAAIFDWWGAVSDFPFGARAPFPQPDENAHWRRRYLNLEKFWPYYETGEVIRGTYSTARRGERERMLEKSEGGLMSVKPKSPSGGASGRSALVAGVALYSQVSAENIGQLLPALRERAGNPRMSERDALAFAAMMGDMKLS